MHVSARISVCFGGCGGWLFVCSCACFLLFCFSFSYFCGQGGGALNLWVRVDSACWLHTTTQGKPTFPRTCKRIQTRVHTRTHTRTHTKIHTDTHTGTDTDTDTHTHTHTHTHHGQQPVVVQVPLGPRLLRCENYLDSVDG